MKHRRIAAFGEVMMRLEVPGHRLLTQSDMLQYSFSGTGVNVAAALARFGYSSAIVTSLPDNALGEAAAAFLRKLGLDLRYVSRSGQYLGAYFLEKGFGIRPSRVTYTNRLDSSFNSAGGGAYAADEIASNVDLICFCGISLAMNETVRVQMKELAAAVKRRGGTVMFDCNYRPSLWGADGYARAKAHYEDMLRLADIAMMNEKDAICILGMPTSATTREEQLAELIPAVAQRYSLSVVAGTHRSVHADNTHSLRGFMFKDRTFTFSEPHRFAVYERIGAGDAFSSGIIHGECAGWSAGETVGFAAAASALAHTTAGDTPVASEADIRQAMKLSIHDVER